MLDYPIFSKYGNKLRIQEVRDSELTHIYRKGEVYREKICTIKNKDDFIECKVTKIDLSTKFMLTERKNNVSIEIRLLGFGFSLYISWRED